MEDIKLMSNKELSIKKLVMENEYEVLKRDIISLYEKMEKMDKEYNKIQSEIEKRSK